MNSRSTEIKDIVQLYLEMDTNYALMITGDWGTGKSHYFKTVLYPSIAKTPVLSDVGKKYKPIMVSLFGLNSLDDIQTGIFLELHSFLKKSGVKLTYNIGRALLKGFLKYKGLDEYSKYVEEIHVKKSTSIKFDEIVICFDDLERISPNLKIDELIGFINSLVENENVKIIIIANEDKIADTNYKILKEKVVGNTIEFIPAMNLVFDSIIASKFSQSKKYLGFLTEEKDFILEVFSKGSTNLRTLIFSLSYFQHIYSHLYANLFIGSHLKEKEGEILMRLLKFTLVVSIEYKEGSLSFKNRHDLEIRTTFNIEAFLSNNNKQKEIKESEGERIIKQYYSENIFHFFQSIYEFITGGEVLRYDRLLQELNEVFHIVKNKVPAQYEVYDKLRYSNCFALSDTEYKRLTRRLLTYSDQGLFKIADYFEIFHMVSRFRNPLNYNLNLLEKRIIRGMKKGKKDYTYQPGLEMYLNVANDVENKDGLLSVKRAILKLNGDLNQKMKDESAQNFEALCYSNFQEFQEKALDSSLKTFFEPIFLKFNAKKFHQFILKSSPKVRYEILKFFYSRYNSNFSSQLAPDLKFLEELKDLLSKRKGKCFGKNVSGSVHEQLNQALQIAIDKLKVIRS